jgi:hypothetical protein
MRVTYSQHARDRMLERAITHQHVQQCLTAPAVTYQGPNSNIVYRAQVQGRMLKVVVAHDRDTNHAKHVVTAAWEE